MYKRYAKIVLSALLCLTIFILSISYVIVHKIIRPKRISTVHIQATQRKWLQQADCKAIEVSTSDGLVLKGIVFERERARRILLGCHGYGKSKESLHLLADLFPDDIVVLFDFRAHGESDGSCVSFGFHERKDIAAVTSFIKDRYKEKQLPLFGLGFSMGAASLIGAAADGVAFDGLILNASFASLVDQVSHVFERETYLPHMPFMPTVTMVSPFVVGFDLSEVTPGQWIASVSCPVSIIHMRDDTYVPVECAYILHENACDSSECWIIDKGGHRRVLSVYPEEYQAKCEAFFSGCSRS